MGSSGQAPRAAHPYSALPSAAYWRTAVADRHFSELSGLWTPKFKILPHHKVATFGSCFAQHIGRALKKQNFNWLDTEPPPAGLSATLAQEYNYQVFTCRTANIYTTSLLLQWTKWALGEAKAPLEVWQVKDRYYDPFRPGIEPNGFASAEELLRLRGVTIEAFGKAIASADCFVFTLGLTESWWNKRDGYEYPTCPGTVAGTYDGSEHEFRTLDFSRVAEAMRSSMDLMRTANPKLNFVLTVSPVPLTATYSGQHVLVATMESKSILRAVAGQFARNRPYVDYFPSYEIINSPVTRGLFLEPNQRTVSAMGVDFVMSHFFSQIQGPADEVTLMDKARPAARPKSDNDVVCEEELLEAFGPAS